LGEKLSVFIKFKKEILQTYVLRMTEKSWIISIKGRVALFVILQPVKNLMFLLNFPPDIYPKLEV